MAHTKAKAVLKHSVKAVYCVLCAKGDFGVLGLNHRIERALNARNLIKTQQELWYHGRPVNGDTERSRPWFV